MDIKLELPSLLNEAATPIAKSVGNTLASTWDIVFGNLDLYAKKIQLRRSSDLEKFRESLEKKIQEVPIENIAEPRLSILGPTMESSKYYYEESELRELFANLLVSSIDSTKAGIIHPSFPQIIQNLSSRDAIFLKDISEHSEIPYCSIRFQQRKNNKMTYFFNIFGKGITLYRYLVPLHKQNDPFCDFNSTIDNLARLKLIEIDEGKAFADLSFYLPMLDSPIYQKYLEEYSNNELILEREVTLVKGVISVTDFGNKFINCCVI